MGFEISEKYRDRFPVTESLIYLNHAAVTPLCRAAADAMRDFADDALRFGSLHYDKWMASYEGLRMAAAKLIGASPREIAIVKNTSEGIATVATGIDWKPGDRVVAFLEEFPANYFPWKLLESQGITVKWLSVGDPLDRIDEAAKGARLLAISFVQYLSGFRADLRAIGEICRRRGCFFFVDAIQGLGVFPLDVEECGVDALSADGHKWLLGPEGCGVLYLRRGRQDEIRPVEFGWTNVAKYADYASRDLALRPDAGRYECGTLNTIGCFGLRAAIEFLLEAGVENIAPVVQALADRIAEGARERGYEVMGRRTPESGSGIVTIHREGVDAKLLVAHLRERGIIAAPRQGWVRMSPHFYIGMDEIERTLSELPS
jgi:cysteine desulfurase/selenocysteine lyase